MISDVIWKYYFILAVISQCRKSSARAIVNLSFCRPKTTSSALQNAVIYARSVRQVNLIKILDLTYDFIRHLFLLHVKIMKTGDPFNSLSPTTVFAANKYPQHALLIGFAGNAGNTAVQHCVTNARVTR